MGRHLQGLPPTPAHPAPGPQSHGDQPGGLTEGFLQHHVHRPDVARLRSVLPLPGSLLQLPGALPLYSPWRPASVSSQGGFLSHPLVQVACLVSLENLLSSCGIWVGGRVPPHPAHHPSLVLASRDRSGAGGQGLSGGPGGRCVGVSWGRVVAHQRLCSSRSCGPRASSCLPGLCLPGGRTSQRPWQLAGADGCWDRGCGPQAGPPP